MKDEELEGSHKGRLGHTVQVLLRPAMESGDGSKTRQGIRQLWAGGNVIREILLDLPEISHGPEWQREKCKDPSMGGLCLLRAAQAWQREWKREVDAPTA